VVPIRPAFAVAVVIVLSVACTSDTQEDVDAHPTRSAATGVSTAPESPVTEPATRESSATSTVTPQPKITKVPRDFWQFRTPSGNIGCAITPDGVLCELGEAAWAPKRPPTPCEDADWNGRAVSVGAQETRVGVCTTDTVLANDVPVLDYDTGLSSGEVQCVSRRDGLTCEHVASNRGFIVSQARLTLF
jgi:hypothetical protein